MSVHLRMTCDVEFDGKTTSDEIETLQCRIRSAISPLVFNRTNAPLSQPPRMVVINDKLSFTSFLDDNDE